MAKTRRPEAIAEMDRTMHALSEPLHQPLQPRHITQRRWNQAYYIGLLQKPIDLARPIDSRASRQFS